MTCMDPTQNNSLPRIYETRVAFNNFLHEIQLKFESTEDLYRLDMEPTRNMLSDAESLEP